MLGGALQTKGVRRHGTARACRRIARGRLVPIECRQFGEVDGLDFGRQIILRKWSQLVPEA
jgi:hypothetical protein